MTTEFENPLVIDRDFDEDSEAVFKAALVEAMLLRDFSVVVCLVDSELHVTPTSDVKQWFLSEHGRAGIKATAAKFGLCARLIEYDVDYTGPVCVFRNFQAGDKVWPSLDGIRMLTKQLAVVQNTSNEPGLLLTISKMAAYRGKGISATVLSVSGRLCEVRLSQSTVPLFDEDLDCRLLERVECE
jgi:hypothetical protein